MFDWVTWSIWLMGLVILVVWIIVPIKEFAGILRRQRAAAKDGPAEASTEASADSDEEARDDS